MINASRAFCSQLHGTINKIADLSNKCPTFADFLADLTKCLTFAYFSWLLLMVETLLLRGIAHEEVQSLSLQYTRL